MRWLGALLALLFTLGAGLARAQPSEPDKARAKQAFEAGVAAFEAKRYDDALASFQEAQRLAPHPMVQVNIANCYDKLGRPVEAIHHFESFLDAGAANDAQRQEVTAALRRLRGQVGRVLFQVRPEGALIVLDGIELSRAPIVQPVNVAAGKHTVDVSLDGYLPATRHLELAPGGVHELTLTLEQAPTPLPAPVAAAPATPVVVETAAPAPVPVAEESAPQERGGIPVAVWVSGGVTGVLLVSAAITGILALDAETDFDNARSLRYSTAQELTATGRLRAYNDAVDAADRANGLALATDILLGAAVVGAGVTTYLYLTQREDDQAFRVMPALARDGAGAAVKARW